MTQELFVVAFDGKDTAVVDYAVRRAGKSDAALHIVHVLEWSPYAFLTPQEIEERHRERTAELARADTEVMQPVLEKAKAAGVSVTGEVRHGSVVSIVCDIAKDKKAEKLFVGRNGDSSLSARIFGSVAIGLAQASPIPIVIVP